MGILGDAGKEASWNNPPMLQSCDEPSEHFVDDLENILDKSGFQVVQIKASALKHLIAEIRKLRKMKGLN